VQRTTSSSTELAGWLGSGDGILVAVDGLDGVGKTPLAAELARILSLSHLDLDSYLDRERGTFLGALSYEALSADLSQSGRAIVSGVCCLEALRKASASTSMHVYVKRMHHGAWADQAECEYDGSAEEHLASLQRDYDAIAEVLGDSPANDPIQGLRKEVVEYHHDYQPHFVADIVFENMRDNPELQPPPSIESEEAGR
jgi:hypothetical protein